MCLCNTACGNPVIQHGCQQCLDRAYLELERARTARNAPPNFQKGNVGIRTQSRSHFKAASANRLLGRCYYSTMCNCCHYFIAMHIFQLPYNANELVYITSRLYQKWSQKTLNSNISGGHAPRPP